MNDTLNTITISRVYPCWAHTGAFHVDYTINDSGRNSRCMDNVDNAYHAVNRLINQVCENYGTSRGQVMITREDGYDNEVKSVPAVVETEQAAPAFNVNTFPAPEKSTLYIVNVEQENDMFVITYHEIDVEHGGRIRRFDHGSTDEYRANSEEDAIAQFTKRWTQDWGTFGVVDVRNPQQLEVANAVAEAMARVDALVAEAVAKREQEVREELQLVGRFGTVISINYTETESNLLYKDVVTAIRNASNLFANNSGVSETGFVVDYVQVIDTLNPFDRVVATIQTDNRGGQHTYFNPYYVTVDDYQTAPYVADLDSFGVDEYYDADYEPIDYLDDVPF